MRSEEELRRPTRPNKDDLQEGAFEGAQKQRSVGVH